MQEGEKIVLRAVEVTDAERVQRWVNESEVALWTDGAPGALSRRSQEKWLESAGAGQEANVRVFAVETKDSRQVGLVQLREIHWIHRRARVELLVGEPEFREPGLESDIIRAISRFAVQDLNLHRLEARLPVGSYRVEAFLAVGYAEEGRLQQSLFIGGAYVDEVVLGLVPVWAAESTAVQ